MGRPFFSVFQKVTSVAFVALLAASTFFSGVDLSPEIKHKVADEMVAQEYSAANHSLLPNGFHESSMLEISRLEHNLLRHALPRFSAQRVWFWYADALDGSGDAIVLLRFNTVLVDATRYSLSHAHLDVRYPIPPPSV